MYGLINDSIRRLVLEEVGESRMKGVVPETLKCVRDRFPDFPPRMFREADERFAKLRRFVRRQPATPQAIAGVLNRLSNEAGVG